jgi:hypothetical protein
MGYLYPFIGILFGMAGTGRENSRLVESECSHSHLKPMNELRCAAGQKGAYQMALCDK